MHRRGHKKSRNGCLECKRRHMKCDESRPQCANCTTVHRACQYLESRVVSRAASTVPNTPGQASTSPAGAASPRTEASTATRSTEEGTVSGGSPASALSQVPTTTTPQTSAPQTPHISNACSGPSAADHDGAVNVVHAELAFHFSIATTSPELDPSLLEKGNQVVMAEAIRAPFLLHECLAVSARHLSILRPEKHDFYLRLSVQLQTRAIAMFNDMDTVDQDNVVASLLFSSMVNRHTLIDVLANRDGGFFSFVDRFVHTVQLQKGIRTVSKAAWPKLLQSDLRPIIIWFMPDRHPTTVGHQCDELRRLISLTPALAPLEKEACRTAIHFLQLAFDAYVNPPPGKSPYQIVYVWGIYLPDEFCVLLKAHRPEAVAVLAWYAVLLHESRDNWQVGDAGEFILHSISDFLGPEWAHWLSWPFSALRDGLR